MIVPIPQSYVEHSQTRLDENAPEASAVIMRITDLGRPPGKSGDSSAPHPAASHPGSWTQGRYPDP